MTAEEAIAAYNQEMRETEGWDANITIQDLIRQSKEYRQYNKKYTLASSTGYREGFLRGYEAGKKALTAEVITLTDLKSMTIQQIIDLLYEE